ncbi:MAG: 30S ribosomal protein S20 [Armatimonadetes bacterium]|nr:30S ribosomal protein S20 [Armatimonadota bacterium]
MPNIKSVVKDVKKSRERRLRNLTWRSKIKTFSKKTRQAIGTEQEGQMLKMTASVVDSAAQKGIIHKNAAARRKSRLMKRAAQAAKTA